MLRSKSSRRSGSVDIGRKSHYSSVFSRTISASKVCRGDDLKSQIEASALISVDKHPLKVSELPENREDRDMSMQQQKMGELQEELMRIKQRVSTHEVEKARVLDLNLREFENLKGLLSSSRDELKIKDKKIESLESELGKARKFEFALKGKDESINILEEELKNEKAKENENKRIILDLEAEVERRKGAESKMVDSLAIQIKKLEATKLELEESKIEITRLRDMIASLENGNSIGKDREIDKRASLNAKNLVDEMESLKNEWKLAIEAEEKSRNAMEDLALALKEVATEANQSNEKVRVTEIELEHVKGETEQLKAMVRGTEEQFQKLLDEAKQEAELYKNTAERLRLEAEEALLAWNGKEMCFVDCIKRAEEEKAIAQHENTKLGDSLRVAREETYKSRDILKQAVNEANAAKAASGIARDENSYLKDCLAEREEKLHFLMRENERLRMNETAACENVKEFKRLLSNTSSEFKTDDKGTMNLQDYSTDGECEPEKKNKNFSLNLEDLKFMNEAAENAYEKVLDEDPEKAKALKGSIFDTNTETPRSEPHTPKVVPSNRRRHSSVSVSASALTKDERGTPKTKDLDHFDGERYDSDSDRNSHRRMKTMFRRVGDLLMVRRSFHRKKPSNE